MVAENPPTPSPTPSPTLRAILAPHAEPDPPSNPTRLLTYAERRAACITSSRNAPSEPALSTFAPFRPDAHALEGVLSDLVSSNHSLDTIAAKHNTSIPALTLWMNRPDVEPLLSQMESACYRHARLAAAHSLPQAVNALTLILNCASEAEASIPIPREDRGILVRERSRTNTRKAAWLLYRISRSHPAIPIDPATRLKLEETRLERARLKAQLKAHSCAECWTTPSTQPAPTTQSTPPTEQSNNAPDFDHGALSTPPSPSPSSQTPTLPPTESLHHSVTDTLPTTESLSHAVTDTLSSMVLRDLRGESSSSDTRIPLDDHDTVLIPCGMTSDTS